MQNNKTSGACVQDPFTWVKDQLCALSDISVAHEYQAFFESVLQEQGLSHDAAQQTYSAALCERLTELQTVPKGVFVDVDRCTANMVVVHTSGVPIRLALPTLLLLLQQIEVSSDAQSQLH